MLLQELLKPFNPHCRVCLYINGYIDIIGSVSDLQNSANDKYTKLIVNDSEVTINSVYDAIHCEHYSMLHIQCITG